MKFRVNTCVECGRHDKVEPDDKDPDYVCPSCSGEERAREFGEYLAAFFTREDS